MSNLQGRCVNLVSVRMAKCECFDCLYENVSGMRTEQVKTGRRRTSMIRDGLEKSLCYNKYDDIHVGCGMVADNPRQLFKLFGSKVLCNINGYAHSH